MTKRSTQEFLLLILSTFGVVAISPFIFIRYIREDWIIATVDLFIVLSMSTVFIYVYKTRKTVIPSIALAIFSACSASATINIKGVENVYWIYPSIVAIYYLIEHKWSNIIVSILVLSVIPVLFKYLDSVVFIAIIATIFLTSCFGFVFSKSVRNQYQLLEQLAIKDDLTGTGNRRALNSKLDEVAAISDRNKLPVSLIMLDIDNFKQINDIHGHSMGDQVLVKISSLIENRLRMTDSLYRYGGEEFIITPLELDRNKAAKVAENIRLLVEGSTLISEKQITVSLGVAEYQPGESVEQWLKRADNALYFAKGNGRNQVHIAD